MATLHRGSPATASSVVITSAPSGAVGVDISTLPNAGARFAYIAVRGAVGSVALPADTIICKRVGGRWKQVGFLLGGKAITVTTTLDAEDFLQGLSDADRVTLYHPSAPGAVALEVGFYDDV